MAHYQSSAEVFIPYYTLTGYNYDDSSTGVASYIDTPSIAVRDEYEEKLTEITSTVAEQEKEIKELKRRLAEMSTLIRGLAAFKQLEEISKKNGGSR